MFFWNASWKASWRVLEAKLKPKPSKMTPKVDPKDTNRALQKVKDFTTKKLRKDAGTLVPQAKK